MNDLNEHGPPQHAWDQVTPGAAEQEAYDEEKVMEEECSIEQEDLQPLHRSLSNSSNTLFPFLSGLLLKLIEFQFHQINTVPWLGN